MYPSADDDLVSIANKGGRTVPLLPEWASIDQIIAEQLSIAFIGQKSPRDALNEAAAKVEEFMKSAGYYDNR
jgi:ABC-type glycerol-3-phosphate transport system substrate-binding protein